MFSNLVGIAIECQTCQEGFCGNGGLSELCPDDIQKCYILTSSQNYGKFPFECS
jgi:hypothetical protein